MRHRSDNIMWKQLFQLSPQAESSLQSQLRERLVAAVLEGRVSTDIPLPSSRELARQLGVARNTVVLAYQQLVDEGFLVAEERRGYFVNRTVLESQTLTPNTVAEVDVEHQPDWQQRFRVAPTLRRNIDCPPNWWNYKYPFVYAQLDPELIPINDWRESCRANLSVAAIQDWTQDRISRDDPRLVEQIQKRVLTRRGVWVEDDQILITLGAQNALYILADLLMDRDSKVAIENPGYPDARNIFRTRTDNLVPIPVDQQGMVVDERLAECDYVYVTPSHQSPTTVRMDLARRQKLLQMAVEHDFVIIEDDYEPENNFVEEPTPSLKSLDRNDRVVYVGSLSKTFAPGLRLGYLVGSSAFISEARALRRLMYRHPPSNNQRQMARFLALGHHNSLVARLMPVYRERWQLMNNALQQHLPAFSCSPSFGGTAHWIEGPQGFDCHQLYERAMEKGILIERGDVYFIENPGPKHCFRLGFSAIPTHLIEEGIRQLGELVGAQLARRG